MPGFGRSQDTCAVVLDGVQVPQSVALHHAEATGMMDPPKTSGWEGDNMMILPQYKCVYTALCRQYSAQAMKSASIFSPACHVFVVLRANTTLASHLSLVLLRLTFKLAYTRSTKNSSLKCMLNFDAGMR